MSESVPKGKNRNQVSRDATEGVPSQIPVYFNPTFFFLKAVGSSDYAVGTMWTRCATGNRMGLSISSKTRKHITASYSFIRLT
jgi:hypothetical protein